MNSINYKKGRDEIETWGKYLKYAQTMSIIKLISIQTKIFKTIAAPITCVLQLLLDLVLKKTFIFQCLTLTIQRKTVE